MVTYKPLKQHTIHLQVFSWCNKTPSGNGNGKGNENGVYCLV